MNHDSFAERLVLLIQHVWSTSARSMLTNPHALPEPFIGLEPRPLSRTSSVTYQPAVVSTRLRQRVGCYSTEITVALSSPPHSGQVTIFVSQ